MRTVKPGSVLLLAALAVAGLTSCTSTSDGPTPDPSRTAVVAEPTPSASAPIPSPSPSPTSGAAPADQARATAQEAIAAATPVDPSIYKVLADYSPEAYAVLFPSPSGNLHCGIVSDPPMDGTSADTGEAYHVDASLLWGCAIDEFTYPLPVRGSADDDCPPEVHYTGGVESKDQSEPELACRTDAPFYSVEDLPALAYGTSVSDSGITCVSREAGMSCVADSGHGFTLSSTAYVTF